MAAKEKNHSLQRKVYHSTRSAVRRWRTKPLVTREPKVLKIFTNVQGASVAGIARVMSSFAEHVNNMSDVQVELACVSVASPDKQKVGGGWQKEKDEKKHITSLLYEGVLPVFAEVLKDAHGVEDVSRAFRSLTDAYRAELKDEKPDVVLINGTYVVAWALMAAARSLRLPVVHYYHGSLSKETEHWEDKKSKRIIRDLELSFDRADVRYVFPSTFVLHYVERHVFRHRLRRGQVLVLPNPIPQAFFDAPIPLVKKGVAFVGRWTRIKNTSFVQRFVALNHHEPQPVGVLVVTDAAGKEKASKVLHDKVVFAGPFHGAAEMARFYSEREAVLCPSYFETYGNVAQEAVAAGTPALVSRNMGVAEVFKKIGLEHLIVSFSNPKEVMDLINEKRIPTITNSARKALQELAGEEVVHTQLLKFIVS